MRVRQHAEEIAFYDGGAKELKQTQTFLAEAISVGLQKLYATAQLDVLQNAFSWFTGVVPYLVVAHRYFSGELEYGVISQTAMAFRIIQVCDYPLNSPLYFLLYAIVESHCFG